MVPLRDSLLHTFIAALGWGPSHFFAGLWYIFYLISFIQDPEHVRPWQLRGAGMTERKRVAQQFRSANYYNLTIYTVRAHGLEASKVSF